MSESFKQTIVQRMFKNFLDLMLLKLISMEPMWGYKIIKQVRQQHGVKLRHGALYPLLNNLEREGLLKSTKEAEGGRVRNVYKITKKGRQLLDAYHDVLKEHM